MKKRVLTIKSFQQKVRNFYLENYREMPWRKEPSAYFVFVSEVMLQQTQVPRVLVKFEEFIKKFPDFKSLASASNHEVLSFWSGLGYNRRAIFLRNAAIKIWEDYQGNVPNNHEYLVKLPGIGPNTASAIQAYVYNEPVVFVETNIRTVFLHEFFPGKHEIDDKNILSLVKQTVDKQNPREWYWALMDYGTFLKKKFGNQNRRSKQYTKQSKFEGSIRQVRAAIIRSLIKIPGQSKKELFNSTEHADHRFDSALDSLVKDGSIKYAHKRYSLD